MSRLLAPLPYPWMPGNDYLASDMHAYGEVCIKQALEAAAKVCDANAKKLSYPSVGYAATTICAMQIRELLNA